MRICAVGDTHRYRHELLTAVKSVQPLDAIVHAGDETSDALWLKERVDWPVYGVAGNWDTANEMFPLERILDFGPRMLLTHGHRWRVKENLSLLSQRAKRAGVDMVVFGHSHVAGTTFHDNILFINPGSLAAPRGRRERTFATIDIEETAQAYSVRVSHCVSSGQTVSGLTFLADFAK